MAAIEITIAATDEFISNALTAIMLTAIVFSVAWIIIFKDINAGNRANGKDSAASEKL